MKRITLLTVLLLFVAASISAQHGMGHKSKSNCGMDGMMHNGMGKGMKGCGMHQGMKGDRMHRGMGIQMLLRNADEINLSDEQVKKLKDMMIDHKLEMVDQKALLEKAQIKLKSQMHDDNSNESAVFEGIDKVAKLKAELHKKKYKHMKMVQNSLSDEQKDKLKSLRKEKREGMNKGDFQGMDKGHGFGRHGG